jgi:beta-glucosidase
VTDGSGGIDVGDGGVPTICASHPLSAKTTWIATASHSSLTDAGESDPLYNPPSHANDGNINERWSTGKPQAGNEWLQIDFGQTVAVGSVTLQLGASSSDHPRGYAARVSATPLDFAGPVLASGAGQQNVDTVIVFGPPAIGRYMLISQTGASSSWWSVAELNVACTD